MKSIKNAGKFGKALMLGCRGPARFYMTSQNKKSGTKIAVCGGERCQMKMFNFFTDSHGGARLVDTPFRMKARKCGEVINVGDL